MRRPVNNPQIAPVLATFKRLTPQKIAKAAQKLKGASDMDVKVCPERLVVSAQRRLGQKKEKMHIVESSIHPQWPVVSIFSKR